MKNAMLLFTLIAAGVLAIGCAKEGGSPQPATVPVTIALSIPSGTTGTGSGASKPLSQPIGSFPQVFSISLEVLEAGGSLALATPTNPFTTNVSPGQLVTVSLQVVPGTNLVFKASGFSGQNTSGVKIYFGQVTTTIEVGIPKVVAIQMNLVSPLIVTVLPSAPSLFPGRTLQFTAAVLGSTDQGVTWSVDGTGTGTITAAGLYTAPSSLGTLTSVTVRATSTLNTQLSGTAQAALVRTEALPFLSFSKPTSDSVPLRRTPIPMAVKDEGSTIIALDCCPNRLVTINLLTSVVTPITSAITKPGGMAISADKTTAYVTEAVEQLGEITVGGRLLSVTLSNGAIRVITEALRGPGPVLLQPGGTSVFVAEQPTSAVPFGRLSSINLATGTINPVTSALGRPTGLVSETSTTVLMAEQIDTSPTTTVGALTRVNLVTGTVDRLLNTLDFPLAIGFQSLTSAIVVEAPAGSAASVHLIRVDLGTGGKTTLTGPETLGEPSGLVMEAAGTALVIARNCSGILARVNVDGSTTVSRDRFLYNGTAIAQDSLVLTTGSKAVVAAQRSAGVATGVTCAGNNITELDLTAGTLTSLVSLRYPSVGMGLDTPTNSLVIANTNNQVVLKSLSTLSESLVSAAGATVQGAVLDTVSSPPRMLIVGDSPFPASSGRLASVEFRSCSPNCRLASFTEDLTYNVQRRVFLDSTTSPVTALATETPGITGSTTTLKRVATVGCVVGGTACTITTLTTGLIQVRGLAVESGGSTAVVLQGVQAPFSVTRMTMGTGSTSSLAILDRLGFPAANGLLLEPGGTTALAFGDTLFRVYIGP